MITLYHGENITGSRQALQQLTASHSGEILHFEGKTIASEQLTQALTGNSLFSQNKLVIIENLSSNKKLIDLSLIPNKSVDLVLWEDHKLSPSQIGKFPQARIQEFKLNQTVFKFVDSLLPNNQKEILRLFQTYASQEIPEIIFSMIIRQFRLMLDPKSNQLPDWQTVKITAQAAKFGPEKLREIYSQLLDIDFATKNGLSAVDLKTSLELFLLAL